MLDAAEVGEYRKLADAAFLAQRTNLVNDLVRRADKTDFAFDNVVVTELCKTLQGAAGIKTISFRDQLFFRW